MEPVSMRLQLDVSAGRYFVGENFPITVRIVNPNPYDVYLSGFDFGALEPHTEIAFPGRQEFEDISRGGTISAMGGPPLRISAKASIEHRRLVYSGTRLDGAHWLAMPAGMYRMRLRSTVGAVRPGDPRRYVAVNWASQEVQFTLIVPRGHDLAALGFLGEKARQLAQHMSDPNPHKTDMTRLRLIFWKEFVERFGDSAYAPEIRLELATLLKQEIGEKQSAFYKDAEMIALLDECLQFCIEQGGAYADPFVWWKADHGGNYTLEFALIHNRGGLLKVIVEAIDRKYPNDEAAKLFRKVLVVGTTESLEAARPAVKELTERFPKSDYVRMAEEALRNLERTYSAARENERP
jgi:hypothetical protein